MALLEVRDISVRFGGIVALSELTFDIEKGQICGLIGPNGAGKTTLFNVVSRIYDPTQGRITFDGEDLLDVQQTPQPARIEALGCVARQRHPDRELWCVTVRAGTVGSAAPARRGGAQGEHARAVVLRQNGRR